MKRRRRPLVALAGVALAVAGGAVACKGDDGAGGGATSSATRDASGAPAPATTPPVAADGKDATPRLLVIDLWGSLPERARPFDLDGAPTLRKVLDRLEQARRDARVHAVLVRIASLEVGPAVADELRAELAAVVTSGKRVVCTLEGGGDDELLASTGCSAAIVSPAAEVFTVGAHAEATFIKPLLDKLGVSADFEHVGRWKGAAEPLQRDSPTPELAETFRAIADGADKVLVDAVAARRGISTAEVAAAIDRSPLTADEAVKARFFDAVGYADETLAAESKGLEVIEAFPRGKPREDLSSLLEMFSGGAGKSHSLRPHVAVVPVVGTIVERQGSSPLSDGASAAELVRALDEARRSDAVKAVVLRISSPGGSALASDLIWRAVARVREKKPVIASMGAVAASGGYYVASGAQKIYADPATVTGSIGVVGGKIVLGGLFDKLGIRTTRFGARANAHAMSPTTRFSPGERQAIQRTMQSTYGLFVDRVAKGRGLSREQVLAVAEGRVFTGAAAQGIHLVDAMGGLESALAEARRAASLGEDAPVETYPGPKGLFDMLARSSEPQITSTLGNSLELALLPEELRTILLALPSLVGETVWALAPFSLRLR